MGKKLDRVYHALIEGATEGLEGDGLYKYVVEHCPKTSSKRIVKASLFALSDPDITDKNILDTVYALAIKYRLASLGVDDDAHEEDEDRPEAPRTTKKVKKELSSATADILT